MLSPCICAKLMRFHAAVNTHDGYSHPRLCILLFHLRAWIVEAHWDLNDLLRYGSCTWYEEEWECLGVDLWVTVLEVRYLLSWLGGFWWDSGEIIEVDTLRTNWALKLRCCREYGCSKSCYSIGAEVEDNDAAESFMHNFLRFCGQWASRICGVKLSHYVILLLRRRSIPLRYYHREKGYEVLPPEVRRYVSDVLY